MSREENDPVELVVTALCDNKQMAADMLLKTEIAMTLLELIPWIADGDSPKRDAQILEHARIIRNQILRSAK